MAFWLPSTFPAPALSIMPYFVYLTDPAQVLSLQATYPDGLSGLSPQAAGSAFGAPIYPIALQSTTWIGTSLAGGVIPPATFWVNNLFYAYDVTVAGGFAPSTDPLLDFAPAPYYWVGFFRHWNTAPAVVQMGMRRWADGMELVSLGGSTSIDSIISRDASRTVDGFGFSQRSRVSGELLTHFVNTYNGVTDLRYSWEILYIRIRRLPAADVNFWRAYGSVDQTGGVALYITAAGAVHALNLNGAGLLNQDFGTSSVLVLNHWYRLDIRLVFNGTAPVCPVPGIATSGSFELLIDEAAALSGVALFTCAVAGEGVGRVQNHGRSTVGNSFADANTLEIDIDDWVNIGPTSYIRPPSGVPALQFPLPTETCKDWAGHHMIPVRATGYNALSNPAWVGDWRSLLQLPPVGGDSGTAVTTSTASAVLAVDTDYLEQQSGCAAVTVAWYNRNISSGGAGYLLGYSILGGAPVLFSPAPIGAGTSALAIWNSILYSPGIGLTTPVPIYPLVLVHKNTPTADGRAITALAAEAEYLGAWGPEDTGVTAPGVRTSTPTGVHNAPYAGTQWGSALPLPLSAVVVQSGIYVGDAFGQDVLQAFPAHWWWVRNLSTPSPGTRWWSSFICAHRGLIRGTCAGLMVQALIDSLNQVRMRLAGADADNNQSGVSYQWIAVSDPGMRFLLNGAFAHNDALAATNALVDADFLAEAAFFQEEFISTSPTSTGWFKGIGHLTDTASLLTAAQTSGVVTFVTGSLSVQSPLYTVSTTSQVAYSLWRRRDGNQVTGNVFNLVTYVGDGTGTRVITIDLSDRSPLFALVCPHNGQSWVRDPSHTGLNSSTANTGVMDTSHILGGGVNSITVGALLNANGIVYDVFALPGLPNPGLWSPNPPDPHVPIFPVPPDPGPGTQWTPAPAPPLDAATGVQTFGNGTDSGGGTGCSGVDLPNGTDSHGVVCE